MPTKRINKALPKHWSAARNEKEEARWWDANSERLMLEAAKRGTLKKSTLRQLLAQIENKTEEETRLLSLRLPESLITRAKQRADREGISYQTLMRSILHRELFKS